MRCQACNKEITKKETLFTESKTAYCNNSMTCTDEHPNSVKNILIRQGAERLFTEDEFEENYFETLALSFEMKDRITKIATKPQSIRLNKIDIAHYLIQLQDIKELSSLSEAIRYCVNKTMEIEPMDSAIIINTNGAPSDEVKAI